MCLNTVAAVCAILLWSVPDVMSQNGWSVSYTSQSICALKDSSVDISCSYTHPSHHTVTQTFWHTERKTNYGSDLMRKLAYQGRVIYNSTKKHHSMRITKLAESDSGIYLFRIITDRSKYSGTPPVQLSITDLQVTGTPDTVTEGQRVTLTCSTTCTLSNNPTYVWYRNNHPVTNKHTKILFLDSVSSEDAGRYSCAIRDHENLPSTAKTLSVRYSPKNTTVSVSSSGEIVKGSSVTLTCSSDANPPVHTYTWYKKNGAEPSLMGSGQNYSITNISSEDSGQYFCRAENQVGSANSSHVSITVLSDSQRNAALIYAAAGFIIAIIAFVALILWIRRRNFNSTSADRKTERNREKDNSTTATGPVSAEKLNLGNEGDVQYANIQFKQQEKQQVTSQGLTGDVFYATVSFSKRNAATQPVKATETAEEPSEDPSVIYSQINQPKL